MRRAVAILCGAELVLSCSRKGPSGSPEPSAVAQRPAPGIAPSSSVLPARERPPGPLRAVVVGGGSNPESTEVSLEQDVALSQRTLPSPGVVLFAGGTDSPCVRELDPAPPADPLLVEVGELFHPRAGRRSRYGRPSLDAERATLGNVESTLTRALSEGEGPLFLHVAAHGDQGATPKENVIGLWGGGSMSVTRLAELHERHPRPLRLVVTSCFSGGFAEIAFAGADEHAGESKAPRCGLFAGTWDRETSGCDANPDRRAQESYNIHFLHALRNTDPAGKPLAPGQVDLDRDGRINLLEGHTRARIAAVSLDVPTTTSERWLRKVERGSAPIEPAILPEDAAVVAELGRALGLSDEGAVDRRLASLGAELDTLDASMTRAEGAQIDRENELRTLLLERWPVLDDAFHPAFARALAGSRTEIQQLLRQSPESLAAEKARQEADSIDARLVHLEVEEARALRLKRAYETLHIAAALVKRGGRAAEYYRTLLECERTVP